MICKYTHTGASRGPRTLRHAPQYLGEPASLGGAYHRHAGLRPDWLGFCSPSPSPAIIATDKADVCRTRFRSPSLLRPTEKPIVGGRSYGKEGEEPAMSSKARQAEDEPDYL